MNTFSNRSYRDGRVATKLPDVLTEMDDHETKSRPSKKMKLVGLSILAQKTKAIGGATGAATATVAPSKKKNNNNKLPITMTPQQEEEHRHDMKSHDCATTTETPGLKPLVLDHPCQEALGVIATTMETNKNDKKTTGRQSPRRGKKGSGNKGNSNNHKTTANSSPILSKTKKQIQFAVDGKAASRNNNKSKTRSRSPQQSTPPSTPPAARATHPTTPPTELAKKRAQVLADYREIDAMLLSEWD